MRFTNSISDLGLAPPGRAKTNVEGLDLTTLALEPGNQSTIQITSFYGSDIVVTGPIKIGFLMRNDAFINSFSFNGDTNLPVSNTDFVILPINVSAYTGKRRFGVRARYITISRIQGIIPNQYRIRRKIPIFDPTFFNEILSNSGGTIAYAGVTDWVLAGTEPEDYN